jgi:hypothetical protein
VAEVDQEVILNLKREAIPNQVGQVDFNTVEEWSLDQDLTRIQEPDFFKMQTDPVCFPSAPALVH